MLKARYQYTQTTAGTGGSGDYLFSLPIVDGVQLQFDSSVKTFNGTMFTSNMPIPQSIVGYGGATGSAFVNNCILYAYSATQFRAFCLNTGTNGGAVNGYTVDATNFGLAASVNESYGFNIDAPISGWANESLITGTFQNVATVSGISSPKLFSANIATTSGTVANNMGGVISSCTAANPTVCTLVGLTVAPNCGVGNKTAATQNTQITAVSSNSISISTASASQSFDVFCLGY
jgi:hypothetical protein